MGNRKGQSKSGLIKLMKRIWLRQFFFAIVVLAAGIYYSAVLHTAPLIAGLIWAMLDSGVVLGAPVYAFDAPPERTRSLILKMFLVRIALAVLVISLMLSLKLRPMETLLGFILLHIFFIINLKFSREQESK